MPLVTNEKSIQDEREGGSFVKLGEKNFVKLNSNVFMIHTHYIKPLNKSVLCMDAACKICKDGKFKRRTEYYYMTQVSDKNKEIKEGLLRLPAPCFYTMNENEEELEIDKRSVVWIIKKTGEGLQTKYATVRGKDVQIDEDLIKKNNKSLVESMKNIEAKLRSGYLEFTGEAESYEDESEEVDEESTEAGNEDVNPDDIPF